MLSKVSGRTLLGTSMAGMGLKAMATTTGVNSRIPVITTLPELRAWRRERRLRNEQVGVVPTMGALHQGHLDLVKRSLERHPFTVMTLFVNPMQFAPTEDLSKYPRTLQRDLDLLSTLLPPTPTPAPTEASTAASDAGSAQNDSPLIVFAPTNDVMYPLRGELQDLNEHKGLSIEMKGWGEVMEGRSRPQFFKGVATVCTKLFNAVEPEHAYFGQKDIQQALLLKIMLTDLLLAHPLPENLHILPTTRDPKTNLALSSRNAYLSDEERQIAPILYKALSAAKDTWTNRTLSTSGENILASAVKVIRKEEQRVEEEGWPVRLRYDYVEVFDKTTFEPVRGSVEGRELVVAGALWVGSTRLIDNLLLGWDVE